MSYQIAQHEAKHGVVAHALGLSVRELRLRPEPYCDIAAPSTARGQLHLAVACLAGAGENHAEGCMEDLRLAEEAYDRWASMSGVLRPFSSEISALLQSAKAELVGREQTVQRVASALLERGKLSGEALDRLITRRRAPKPKRPAAKPTPSPSPQADHEPAMVCFDPYMVHRAPRPDGTHEIRVHMDPRGPIQTRLVCVSCAERAGNKIVDLTL